ncbi:hypothetical protein CAPTEDRAFT_203664 [Capitella teleta]|uniref:LysM domain-containing protein n=1 Tax=Capitella teleta TaxID=283909 RepID=R7V4N0_CAPTE|nr:hypothetical protein CAPTEDRAFT_203664 [Capitella teleta]|eukprot:ELU10720.1 hypothetical protein CAPTEDRAFT_203664 [Capitella teleta]
MKRGYAKAVAKERKHLNGEAARLLPGEAQVQNVPSARVYVFGDVDVEDEEINNDEMEMPSMRSRGHPKKAHKESMEPQTEIFERTIAEGDTLQSIALKYSVQDACLETNLLFKRGSRNFGSGKITNK